jgi:ubiquitin C-terminal hydrolase
MHTALIFKEQAKVKELGLRGKALAQPHYLIQHVEGYDLVCYKEKIYIPQSLRHDTNSTVLVP